MGSGNDNTGMNLLEVSQTGTCLKKRFVDWRVGSRIRNASKMMMMICKCFDFHCNWRLDFVHSRIDFTSTSNAFDLRGKTIQRIK